MAYKVSDCITEARGILQDTDNSVAYRVSDADMVIYANGAVNTIALHRPDLFSVIGTIPVTANTTLQAAPAASLRLMEIFRIVGGRVVKEAEHSDLDEWNIDWHNDAAGPTVNWVRHPRDPNKFFIYPQADAGTAAVGLVGQWSQAPSPPLASGDNIPIPDAYKPLIVEYMVWRAESRDDEFVSSPRAILFFEVFKSNLGVSAKTKATADSDIGNRDLQRASARAAQQTVGGVPNAGQSQAAAVSNSDGL